MKKYIAVILAAVVVLTMTFALSACKKDESADLKNNVVTNEAGEVVTDENGNEVTERVNITADAPDDSDDTDVVKPGPAANSDATVSEGKKGSEPSSKKAGKETTKSNGKTTANTTAKKDTTTKKETTTKPKKRKVSVTINLPYYNNQTCEMTVWYKVLGEDKEYTALDPQKVVLNNTSVEVDLGKLKGDVRVVVKFKEKTPDISDNKVTIKSNQTHGEITLVTGIEMMDDMM